MVNRSGILFTLLLGISLAQQFVPIPKRPEGYTLSRESSAAPSARFDVFMDLNCSDCKQFYPQWKDFIERQVTESNTSTPVKEKVEIHYHLISLPYHHNSFFCHKLAAYVEAQHNDKTLQYFDGIFENQEKFLSAEAGDLNETEVIDLAIKVGSEATGIAEDDLRKAWDGRTYEDLARVEWKFAVSNAIVGTPGIMLNGVLLQTIPSTADEMYNAWEGYFTAQPSAA